MRLARTFAFFLPLLSLTVVACGGATAGDGSPSGTEASGPGTPKDGTAKTSPPTAPGEPVVFNSGTTTPYFYVGTVEARRQPALAQCGEKSAPFSDNDLFTLQLVGSFSTGPARFTSVAVSFNRRADDGEPRSGDVKGLDSSGHQGAELDGVQLSLLSDYDNPVQSAGVVLHATFTALAFPKQDGETLSARIQLGFADGTTFDATVTGKLKSFDGPCGGPLGG